MNNPFDHTNIGLRERPTSGDLNQLQSQIYQTMREICRVRFAHRTSGIVPSSAPVSGFVGDGFRVVPANPTAMSVVVTPGLGFIYDAVDLPTDIGTTDLEQVNDLSPYKPVWLGNAGTFTVPTAPGAGQGRTDIIEVKIDRRLENSIPRRQLDVGSLAFLDHTFSKTLAYGLDARTGVVLAGGGNSTAGMSYKIGTAAAVVATGLSTPGRDNLTIVAPPATSPGYVKIAEIHVNNGTTVIEDTRLVDRRLMLGEGGVMPFHAEWHLLWNSGAPTATLLSMQAPPGVRLGLTPTASTRGAGVIFLAAGAYSGVGGRAELNNSGSVTSALVLQANGGFTLPFLDDGSGYASTLTDAATPPITVGLGSKITGFEFTARYIDASAVNVTNVALEDLNIAIHGLISC